MDKRTQYLLGRLRGPPPSALTITATAAWAAERLPGAQAGEADIIGSLVAHVAWTAPASALEAALPDLHRCEAAGVPDPASMWRHVARNLEHGEVAVRLMRLVLERGYSAAGAREHAEVALRCGVEDPEVVRVAVMGSILTGRFARARALLQRHPRLPGHGALTHLATEEGPLPAPQCGCADHPDRGEAEPPSAWLKPFFSEGDSLYDAVNMLCLSCHTFWQGWDDYINDTSGWTRTRGEGYADPRGWQLGMDDASPGAGILSDRGRFIRWIRSLEEAVASYGMV